MLDQLRKAVELAAGVAEIPRRQATKIARELSGRGGGGQVSSLAEAIMRRSKENADMVRALVASEVRRQIKALGLATREDVERLNRKLFVTAKGDDLDRVIRRIEKLEASGTSPAKPKTAAKKTTAKTPTRN